MRSRRYKEFKTDVFKTFFLVISFIPAVLKIAILFLSWEWMTTLRLETVVNTLDQ